jgi:sugar-phosphatase
MAVGRLAGTGLPVPDLLVPADEITHGKPDPEGYLRGARLLGVAPEDAVVIEDAPAGIAAGRAAGARVIALTTTHPPAALGEADAIVPTLARVHARVTADTIELAPAP